MRNSTAKTLPKPSVPLQPDRTPSPAERAARTRHVPVLEREVVSALARPAAVLIDGTLGDGGHAAALLRESGDDARLLGLDLDRAGLARAEVALAPFGQRVRLVHDTFAHIEAVARREGFSSPTGILFDLGMSTHHLGVERGFSFHNRGALDMRYDTHNVVALPEPEFPALRRLAARVPSYTAAHVLQALTGDELADLLRQYGDERHASRIAAAVVASRRRTPIVAVPALVQLIVRALPSRARHGRLHAATRTFQALRIAVNREVESLREGIRGALTLLSSGGRLAIISFHSGEDRLVKSTFRAAAASGAAVLLTKHTIRPAWQEQQENLWGRSARLRVIEIT